jgi:ABC-type multidrug transport system ATPase subunit
MRNPAPGGSASNPAQSAGPQNPASGVRQGNPQPGSGAGYLPPGSGAGFATPVSGALLPAQDGGVGYAPPGQPATGGGAALRTSEPMEIGLQPTQPHVQLVPFPRGGPVVTREQVPVRNLAPGRGPAPNRNPLPGRSPVPGRNPVPGRSPGAHRSSGGSRGAQPVRSAVPQAQPLRIGSAPHNDMVVQDPSVSEVHAEFRYIGGGRYEIADVGSRYGTYVNRRRVHRATIRERDIVGIGRTAFRLIDGQLRGFTPEPEAAVVARELTVQLGGERILLDHVTVPIGEQSLIAVLGPSGAGKSTFLGALTGTRPATSGTVVYGGRDLYENYEDLRHEIGMVPQDNILHGRLSARRALRYAAALRFPGSVKAGERDRRVDEVLGELGLAAHAQTLTSALSGGQQKRLNVAMELLTKPSLLVLDEPTSGLDPGTTRSVWEMMRELADDGRTVIVATHEVEHLDMCDRVLVLVPLLDADGEVLAGGRVAYYGPPAGVREYFGKASWAMVFEDLNIHRSRDWAARFARSRYHDRYVTESLGRLAPQQQASEPGPVPRGWFGQFFTLMRRYFAVIAADRVYLAYMALLPIVLGLTVRVLGTAQGLTGAPHTNINAQLVLTILVLAASLNGASSSIEELIKERPIYHRERAAGLSPGAYLASKVIVLGAVNVVQAAVLVGIGIGGLSRPPSGVVFRTAILGISPVYVEIWIATAMLAVVSMATGLFISAAARSKETVFQLLVGLTLTQVVMSGGSRQLIGVSLLDPVSNVFPSRWAYGAAASTVNLGTIGATLVPEPRWTHTAITYLLDMSVQSLLGMVVVVATWCLLRISRPGTER